MNINNIKKGLSVALVLVVLAGCSKTQYLNARPSSSLVIPNTINDLQALLDVYYINETPALGETASDNYEITSYPSFQSMAIKDQNTYLWAPDIFQGQGNDADWNEMYQNVFYANVILDQLPSIQRTASNSSNWDNIKGAALFTRAYQFWNLAQIFAPPFDSTTGGSDLGIPLKLSSNVNTSTTRATVKDTYAQLISDLKSSIPLLPTNLPSSNMNRPSRPAAYAMLARVYLSMRAYNLAFSYADTCLQMYSTLVDYNQNSNTTTTPWPTTNAEVLYQSTIYQNEQVLYTLCFSIAGYTVDTTLYKSYSANDLRSYLYFNPKSSGIFAKLSYSIVGYFFSGLANDEVYLIRAEAAARAGTTSSALSDLNYLLAKRYKTGTFIPYAGLSQSDLLSLILIERRKELLLRGLRWSDLRRLNKEGANIILTRLLNGQTFTLSPNSPLYTFPIPPDVIAATGIPQNNRQ